MEGILAELRDLERLLAAVVRSGVPLEDDDLELIKCSHSEDQATC